MLADTLEMAVVYSSSGVDPSSAAVADRLRKQAKTRAVRLVREAIACPQSGITSHCEIQCSSVFTCLFLVQICGHALQPCVLTLQLATDSRLFLQYFAVTEGRNALSRS
jgi:hypothetical protein